MAQELTVGVPVYNAERLLPRCLENLCAEQFDFRILIADNASTDGTQAIARDFASRDERIVYHRHDENIGMRGNFAYLFHHTDSELFAWRAYDDLSSPHYFRDLSQALLDAPDRTLAVGGLTFEASQGDPPADRTVPDALPTDLSERRDALFRIVAPAWMYGVYRRQELIHRYEQISDVYPYGWGFDMLMHLPYLLHGSVVTVADRSLTQYLSDKSVAQFRPKGVVKPVHMVAMFCRYGFRCADEVAENRWHRLSLYRRVIAYANGSAEKFDRIARRAAFWPYYRAVGRL